MYGSRARIGYTSVAFVTETFPYAFYRMVPEGVSLALLTMHQTRFGPEEMSRLYDETMVAARALAEAKVDLVVLGGRPVLLSRGAASLEAVLADLEQELGVPVTSDATAQLAAFRALGSRKVATVHPFGPELSPALEGLIGELGLQSVGALAGCSTLVDLPRVPASDAIGWGRQLLRKHPDADTLLFPCPHWATTEAIDVLEKEFGVDVVTNLQVTVWHALRKCGIDDRIEGFGRLLREY